MSKSKRIVIRIIQIIAAIALVVAILLSTFFVVFKSNIDKYNKAGSVPEIFGKQWITISSDKFSDIVPKDSMVILQPVDTSNLTGTEVLLYETGNTTVDNSVYGKFSLGRLVKTSDNDDPNTITVQNTITKDNISVPLESVKSKAIYQIALLGKFISQVSTNLGIVQFVVIPIAVFVILLLLIFILNVLFKNNNPDTKTIKDNFHEKDIKLKIDSRSSHDNTLYEDRLSKLKYKNIVNSKKPEIKSELINSSEVSQKNNLDNLELDSDKNDSKSDITDINQNYSDNDILDFKTDEIISNIIGENNVNTAIINNRESTYDDASAQVDEFLRSLNVDLDSVKHEYMGHTTIEFDIDSINDRLNLSTNDKSQDLLDNILIGLKDNAVDFNFNSLKSESVEIQESRKGDGFIIKTPNYKANIKVEIDKN